MNENDLQTRMEQLRSELRHHNYRYYVLNDPVISDVEYDRLLDELQQLEEEHPQLVTPDSPTQRAGAPPAEGFTKVEHPAPILSLDNAYTAEEARAWLERIQKLDERVATADFIVEPKLDGLTVVLHYRDGLFVQGTTRGNGEVGEDITRNLRTIRTLPLRIPVDPGGPAPPPYLVVRGEAFMPIEDFQALNERLQAAGEKTYLNPRNTAAGALRQLDPSLTASRPLTVLCYAIVTGEGDLPDSQWATIQTLQRYGFPVPEVERCPDLETALQVVEDWTVRRDRMPYELDGMVIKINDLGLSDDLGVVGKDPRGALAYKFPAQEVTTRLEDIGVNVGRTGVLTPYALLEPVEIGGVIVRKATLHNFDFIGEKDIRVGDRVRVKRAGDVIPYVIGPIPSARTGDEEPYEPPKRCPSCDEPVENPPGEVAWYCVNARCPAQLIRNLEHFVSRGAMDISGLGIKIVEQLVGEELVQDVADLYALDEETLLGLEGFAEKKALNLIQAIQESKERPLSRLITALGIRGVGEVVAGDLARNFGDLAALGSARPEELLEMAGIGPNIAEAILAWFSRPANQRVLEKLQRAGVWPEQGAESDIAREDLPLTGMTFVVTGTLESFTRQEVKTYIQSRGGKVTGSISGNTDYLVAGENPGSKRDRAENLGVSILSEDDLLALAEGR